MNIASFPKDSEEHFYLDHFPHQAVLSRPVSCVLVTLMQKGINLWSSSLKVSIMPRLSGYTNSLMRDKLCIFSFVQCQTCGKVQFVPSLLPDWDCSYKVQRWMGYLPLKNGQCYFPSQTCDVPVMMASTPAVTTQRAVFTLWTKDAYLYLLNIPIPLC